MKKYAIEITVFLSGATVMVFEIVGSRILAPYIGNTIIVWTSLIGIILASLAFGYWLGGNIADKNASHKTLVNILFLAAAFLFLTGFLNTTVLEYISGRFLDLRLASFFSAFILFAPASVVLGSVSPYAIRLKLKKIKNAGAVSGTIIAISTTGSILGTFGSGFFLLGKLGSIEIIYLLCLVSFINALLLYLLFSKVTKKQTVLTIFIVISAFGFWSVSNKKVRGAIADVDTRYSRIVVEVENNFIGGKDVQTLRTGRLRQSGRFLNSDELAFEYTKYYRLGSFFNPDIKNVLMIGGGGFSYPQDFLLNNPEAAMDVVEIDPSMTEVAKKYFGLKNDDRLSIYHEDARRFINKSDKVYDAIYIDAFNSDITVPFQLVTREVVEQMHVMLSENGVVIVNLGGTINGDRGRYVRSQYVTYKTVFKEVLLFPTRDPDKPDRLQNIMLIALKKDRKNFSSKNPEIQNYLDHLYKGDKEWSDPVLTDNFAPVEYFMIAAYIN